MPALILMLILSLPLVGRSDMTKYDPQELLKQSSLSLEKSNNFKMKQEELKRLLKKISSDIKKQEQLNKEEGDPSEDALYRFELKLKELQKIKKENSETKCSELGFKLEKDKTLDWDSLEAKKWLEVLCKD